MSTWIEITDPDDVELDPETDRFNILYSTDEFGNNYVTLPGSMIRQKLQKGYMQEESEILNEIRSELANPPAINKLTGRETMLIRLAVSRTLSRYITPAENNLKNSKPCGNSSESWNFV